MKPVLSLVTIICLVVPAAGQSPSPANTQTVAVDPTTNDPTVKALTALLESKKRAAYGKFLVSSGRFAALADKELLLRVKSEADRPNYGGNAAAKTSKNLWLSVIEGKVQPPQIQRGKPGG
jgi:hypothetical protein